MVPNSSSEDNENGELEFLLERYSAVEFCYHCCFFDDAVLFSAATLPHPRQPIDKRSVTTDLKLANMYVCMYVCIQIGMNRGNSYQKN